MGVCCRYALSRVIPARLRDSSYSRGRDFNSFAISLASFPGRTGKVNAIRDILVPPDGTCAKSDRTASLLDTPTVTGRYAECPRQEDRRDEQPFALRWTCRDSNRRCRRPATEGHESAGGPGGLPKPAAALVDARPQQDGVTSALWTRK